MADPLPDNHPNRSELYAARLDAASADTERYAALDHRIANGRVVAFVAIAIVLVASCRAHWHFAWAAFVPMAVFLWLIVHHESIADALETTRRRVRFYQRGIQRLTDAWAGTGDTGSRYVDTAHPYSPDIDIFGQGSLYELLCTCRTRSGEDCLAEWLLTPGSAANLMRRQEAVRELCDRLGLREDIALLGEETGGTVVPDALAAWGEGECPRIPAVDRVVAGLLACANVGTFAFWATGHTSAPLIVALIATAMFNRPRTEWIAKTIKTVGRTSKPLNTLAVLMGRVEREEVASPLLVNLRSTLTPDGNEPPSERIKRFDRLVAYLEATLNAAFMPIAFLLLWQFQFAATIQLWRAENGPRLRGWMRATGEFEVLCAFANFQFENADAVFPAIAAGPPCVVAESLNHPLLPRTTRIGNDIAITRAGPLLIVSGSNMSGKSTLMRTVGVNVALALAGAPVLARSMTVSPLSIGASIRTQDSLQGGVSRFYAEIMRIRQVVDLAGGDPPLLFLLDEILHGTNSHDRRIGAEAILRSLVAHDAIGIVTTHDLALAMLADDPGFGAVNVHLEDQIVDGKMVFDYHVRPGIVEKSNAIELMRAVGLDV